MLCIQLDTLAGHTMNERFEYFGEVKFILIILNSLCGQHMHLFVNKT